MEINSFIYENLEFKFNDLDIKLTDDNIGKLAVALRTEYPIRREMGKRYFGINNELRRVFIIDNKSVIMRFDKLNDISEVFNEAGEVANILANVLELQHLNVSSTLELDIELSTNEESFRDLSVSNLRPEGINIEDFPGEVKGFSSRVIFESGDYEYDFSLFPHDNVKKLIYSNSDMELINDNIKIPNDKNNFIHILQDFRHVLEGTVKRIIEKW